MKKEKNILLIGPKLKLWESQLDIKDSILNWIEYTSSKIHNWASDKRWKDRDQTKWIKGYKEWKKSTEKGHN